MSDYQHERGKLIPLERLTEETDYDYVKRVLGDDFEWDIDLLDSIYINNLEDKYMVLNDKIYEIAQKEELDPYGDVNILTENPDGSLSFECRYYNGGTCLYEMIEEKLNEK